MKRFAKNYFSSAMMGFLFIVLLCFKSVSHAQLKSLPIPDHQTYSEFLVKPWQANQPTLVTFKDPRCPHCANALKKISRLDNYNVFVFWAPILGEQSKGIVNEIFRCERLTSEDVFNAVSKRKAPMCSGVPNKALRELNDAFVTAYNPRSVPQYWMGGSRVQVAQLSLAQTKNERIASLKENADLFIPWQRYSELSVTPSKRNQYNAALILPKSAHLDDLFKTSLYTDDTFKWHVVESKSANTNQEFMLLTNLIDIQEPKVVVEGKVLTRAEMNSLLSDSFMKNFNSLGK